MDIATVQCYRILRHLTAVCVFITDLSSNSNCSVLLWKVLNRGIPISELLWSAKERSLYKWFGFSNKMHQEMLNNNIITKLVLLKSNSVEVSSVLFMIEWFFTAARTSITISANQWSIVNVPEYFGQSHAKAALEAWFQIVYFNFSQKLE